MAKGDYQDFNIQAQKLLWIIAQVNLTMIQVMMDKKCKL